MTLALVLCAVTALTILCLAGCSSKSTSSSSSDTGSSSSSSSSSSGGAATDQTTVTVALPANATTGYQWNYIMDKDGIIEEQSSDYTTDDSATDKTGVGGTQTFVFKAVADGTVTVSFTYARNWQGGDTSGEYATYVYTVKDGNITQNSVDTNVS